MSLAHDQNEWGALTEAELHQFRRDGFLGPFYSPIENAELDRINDYFLNVVNEKSEHPIYKRYSVRDWHLIDPKIAELVSHPEVLIKLKQILGEDLLLWRSKIFHKRPGDQAIEWHQEWGAFNGEEIGNDIPGLLPSNNFSNDFWNLTIWVALVDVTMEMGPMQFVKESYKTRYPIDMIPMTESAFWQDPFLGLSGKQEIVERCFNSKLILDVDSSQFLKDCNVDTMSEVELKELILKKFSEYKAAITLPFDVPDSKIATVPVKKGQYFIFPERTMHRSIANISELDRMAVNFRVTPADTLVYPGRLKGHFMDGSNLDITDHKCVLLSGQNLNEDNQL